MLFLPLYVGGGFADRTASPSHHSLRPLNDHGGIAGRSPTVLLPLQVPV
jgi:hypothetical protein